MFQKKKVTEKIKTYILSLITFFENRSVYEIMWKNIAERGCHRCTTWPTRISCWIPKTTNTHTQVVVTLTASPLQQWLHVCALMSRYSTLPVLL